MTKCHKSEAKVVANEFGGWDLMVRPAGLDCDWLFSMASSDKQSVDRVAAWWQGREMEWDFVGEDDEE